MDPQVHEQNRETTVQDRRAGDVGAGSARAFWRGPAPNPNLTDTATCSARPLSPSSYLWYANTNRFWPHLRCARVEAVVAQRHSSRAPTGQSNAHAAWWLRRHRRHRTRMAIVIPALDNAGIKPGRVILPARQHPIALREGLRRIRQAQPARANAAKANSPDFSIDVTIVRVGALPRRAHVIHTARANVNHARVKLIPRPSKRAYTRRIVPA